MKHALRLTASSLMLAFLSACGGGGGGTSNPTPTGPTAATGLDYTNPASGTFRLLKNTAKSTPSLLVLDLEASGAPALAGVALVLSTDAAKAAWLKVDATDAELAQGGAFPMGESVIRAKVQGGELQAGFFQRGGKPLATSGTVVLARFALQLKPGVNLLSQAPVTLAIPAGKARILNPAGAAAAYTDIQVAVGSLLTR